MDKTINAVGIDVAKASLSICTHYTDDSEKVLTIRNTDTDISIKLLPLLNNCKSKIVMESTGHYQWLVALLLSKNGYNVYVVNPLLASQYITKNIRKVKSDPADASGLARMARVADNLPEPFKSNENTLWMRKKLGLLSSLSKQIQALKASIASVKEAQEIIKVKDSLAIIELEETLNSLEKSKEKLEKECVDESKKNEKVKKEIELLNSIPGISEFAATLCLHWFDRDNGSTAKSWIAYSGSDISVKESDTWKGKCKLTKRGNAYLRKRLYCCAWGAYMHDPNFKKYYDDLREQGRPHVESLLIIMRKLIRIMYSVLETGQPYDAKKCFLHE